MRERRSEEKKRGICFSSNTHWSRVLLNPAPLTFYTVRPAPLVLTRNPFPKITDEANRKAGHNVALI